MRELNARCEWAVGAELGEGPLWVEEQNRLYFVDLKSGMLHALDSASGERLGWQLPDYLCWLVPRRDGDGFIAGLRREVVRLWLEPQLRIEPLPLALSLPADVRLNDAKADVHGHLWFGTMNNADVRRPDGRLFRLSPGLELREQEREVHICNGPAFSTDGLVMYHTDSLLGRVHAYPVGPGGVLGAPRLWRQFDRAEGDPDGMATDCEGGLWIAQWGGARVCRYLPDGTLDAVVHLPVSQPSSCAFGGPGLSTLYITSARQDLSPQQLADEPLAGALFSVEPGVRGLPPARFG
ncbi:MAG: SMP-30/gluconolactonase/LRE family protein [Massilia sp.]